MRVVIYACETCFGGLHGMYDMDVFEVDSMGEAYEDQIEDSYSEPDWSIVEITDKNTSLKELKEACGCLSFEEFVEKYCKN